VSEMYGFNYIGSKAVNMAGKIECAELKRPGIPRHSGWESKARAYIQSYIKRKKYIDCDPVSEDLFMLGVKWQRAQLNGR